MADYNYAQAKREWLESNGEPNYFFVRVRIGSLPVKWHAVGSYNPGEIAQQLRKAARDIDGMVLDRLLASKPRKSKRKAKEKELTDADYTFAGDV